MAMLPGVGKRTGAGATGTRFAFAFFAATFASKDAFLAICSCLRSSCIFFAIDPGGNTLGSTSSIGAAACPGSEVAFPTADSTGATVCAGGTALPTVVGGPSIHCPKLEKA